jgi:hypothetical protein
MGPVAFPLPATGKLPALFSGLPPTFLALRSPSYPPPPPKLLPFDPTSPHPVALAAEASRVGIC